MDMHLSRPVSRCAFTLVELSIVLVIIGLLVGGVLAGRTLIRVAELRRVITSYSAYTTAFNAFKNKYLGLPGDLSNATAFWPADPNCGFRDFTSTMTCNGDGDGRIGGWTHATATMTSWPEIFAVWNQLALAGGHAHVHDKLKHQE